MKKRILVTIGVFVIVLIGYFTLKGNKGVDETELFANVKFGRFQIDIETTGELEAKNSTKINGPTQLRQFRVYNVAIESIVEEGTVVRKGDWVATLDRSELQGRLQDAQLEVDRMMSQYTQTQLDTTLQMRQARDEIVNLQYAIIEREIEVDQSQFEPPATQRQAEMNLEKAKRSHKQAIENYSIREDQNKAKMAEVNANLKKEQRDLQGMQDVIEKFTVLAPEDGMVIYKKGFDGKPVKEGSSISAWDPVVAKLPDLSVMISKTYINEVDVRKIKSGQHVEIGLDAFPEKKLLGTVLRVANVGEQRPNSDAKVFMVTIQVHGRDKLLRPAMTTSNKVIVNVFDSTLYIPLECLHTEFDSITYVFNREGINVIKQEVMVGETNANEAIIQAGLERGDRLYLSIPSGQEDKRIALLPEMDGKRWKPEPEIEVVEIPQERTITLPDGRTFVVPANGGSRAGFQQGGARSGGQRGSRREGSGGEKQQGSQKGGERQNNTSKEDAGQKQNEEKPLNSKEIKAGSQN